MRRAGLVLTAFALVAGALTVQIGVETTRAPGASAADAAGYSVTGIDTSRWQHPNGAAIDWNAVRSSGVSFAFLKASQGPDYVDPWFASDWTAAGRAGLYRGAYMYAEPRLPTSSAVDDARHFVGTVGYRAGLRDLPPVLDLESNGGLSPSDLSNWTASWLGEVKRLTGRSPIIYTGYYFWRDSLGNTSRFAGYPLWYARYNTLTSPGDLFGGWSRWTFWQWTSTGRVPGITGNVDLDRFAGRLDDLARLTPDPDARNPFGYLDRLVPGPGPGALTASGWSIDPDSSDPILVDTYVDGQWRSSVRAGRSRPDVEDAHPGWGDLHGYSTTIPVAAGRHQVCSYGINEGIGNTNTNLGCWTVTVGGNPIGASETASFAGANTIVTSGWTLDPDTAGAILVDTYVDGRWRSTATANLARPDVEAAQPGYGANHGYRTTIGGVSPGTHQVCSYAINVQAGDSNPVLGCRSVVTGGDPVGAFESATPLVGNRVRVTGWANDFDTPRPITVDAWVDGQWVESIDADTRRLDIFSATSSTGTDHGFDEVLDLGPGVHQVCLYAINVHLGDSNPGLGCRAVSLGGSPRGSLEGATAGAPGSIVASGWAIDPDTTDPIIVDTYVDGRFASSAVASASRPDIGATNPGAGDRHGYTTIAAGIAPGEHQVCSYAIDVGAGGDNSLLGCRRATIGGDPFGYVDTMTRTGSSLSITGWAADPDTTDPIRVDVYVDGRFATAMVASGSRPDVDRVFPGYGANHGFSSTLTDLPGGAHQVCVYAINVLAGSNNPPLGCRSV